MTRTTIRSEDITSGTIPETDLTPLETDIALLGFKVASTNSLAQYSLNNQIINEFASSSDGVDASASTNESWSSGYWKGGSGGSGLDSNTLLFFSGEETLSSSSFTISSAGASSTITATLEGNANQSTSEKKFGTKSIHFDGSGDHIHIPQNTQLTNDFGGSNAWSVDFFILNSANGQERRLIYTDNGYVNFNFRTETDQSGRWEQSWATSSSASRNHNTGSAGDGMTAPGYDSWNHYAFTWDGSTTSKVYVNGNHLETYTTSATNGIYSLGDVYIGGYPSFTSSFYGYLDNFRWRKGVSTTDANDPLYISSGTGFTVPTSAYTQATADDLTLQSTASTASSTPTKGDLILLYSDQYGTASLNSDIKGYISRDGTNFTEVTLTSEGTYGSQKVAVAHDVTLTSASGTSMKWKITTHNQSAESKETYIHAVSLGWS